jgi:hypothetical protein
MTGFGANSPLARAPATARLPPHSGTSKYAPLGQGAGIPAPLPFGESEASLVKGGSERHVSAIWMPF